MEIKDYETVADTAFKEVRKLQRIAKWLTFVLILALGVIALGYYSIKTHPTVEALVPITDKLHKLDKRIDDRFKSYDFEYFITHAEINGKKLCISGAEAAEYYTNEKTRTPLYELMKSGKVTCSD